MSDVLENLPALPYLPNILDGTWRDVFFSLRTRPQILVLTSGAIDAGDLRFLSLMAQAADKAGRLSTLLMVGVDESQPSVPDLPPNLEWMSLAKFDSAAKGETREAMVLALLWSLRPPIIIVRGTDIGLRVIKRYNAQIRRYMRVILVTTPSDEIGRAEMIAQSLACMLEADFVLMDGDGISEAERIAYGVPKKILRRIIPLDIKSNFAERSLDDIADVMQAENVSNLGWHK
jgi:hypothetical protein